MRTNSTRPIWVAALVVAAVAAAGLVIAHTLSSPTPAPSSMAVPRLPAPHSGVRSGPEGLCPPVEARAPGMHCVSADPNGQNLSNHMFQARATPNPALARQAVPLETAARKQLKALPKAQRGNPQAVAQALHRAGLPADGIQARQGDSPGETLFGASTSSADIPGVCVYGTTDATSVDVQIGGLILDGGCLEPLPGH